MSVRSVVVALSLFLCLVAVGTNGASILDLFNWEVAEKLIGKEVRGETETNSRNCLCKGPACICCVDLNITFVDLGGPGCVHMKYLSPEQGFAVNVSYGNSLLHSSTIKGANSPPICLDVFAKLAQMCARFSELAPTADGLRGCLQLEPRLLGDTQLEFPVGCFRSGPQGMHMEPPVEPEKNDGSPDEETAEGDGESEDGAGEDESSFNAEDFLNVVNQTAEQGIALFSSFLGLPPTRNETSIAAKPPASTDNPAEITTDTTLSRRGKELIPKHPNKL